MAAFGVRGSAVGTRQPNSPGAKRAGFVCRVTHPPPPALSAVQHLFTALITLLLACGLAAQDFPAVTTVCTEGPFPLHAPLPQIQGAYRWERSLDGGSNWQVTGANADTLLIQEPTSGVSYRLRYGADAACLEGPACYQQTAVTRLNVAIPRFAQGVRICAGDTLFVGDVALTAAGSHRTVLSTTAGCDRIVETFVELLPDSRELYYVDLCAGDSFRGLQLTRDTVISEVYTAAAGCDSTVTYEITVGGGMPRTLSGPDRLCAGDTVTLAAPGQFAGYAWSTGATGRSISVTETGTYFLTLTNAAGCAAVIEHAVTATELAIAAVDATPPTCPGSATGILTVTATGDEGLLYGTGGVFQSEPVLAGLTAGNYTVTVENADGCQATTEATVPPADSLALFTGLPATITVDRGDTIRFDLTADFAVESWTWSTDRGLSCTDCPNPLATPVYPVTYTVTATAAGGCSVSEIFAIDVADNRRYYAPNAFHPGGQEANDRWRLFTGASTAAISELRIADRWGGIRYRTTEALPPDHEGLTWDGTDAGKPLPAGTYFFTARLHFTDGSEEQVGGPIHLLR